MDAEHFPMSPRSMPQGGTVEPARPARPKDQAQKPVTMPGERYELRDFRDELTYRSKSYSEITDKADRLGATILFALSPDGSAAMLRKQNGEWHRGPQQPPVPERSGERNAGQPSPVRDSSNVLPLRGDNPAGARPEAGDARSLAAQEARAERASRVASLEARLMERYLIKRAPLTVGELTVGRTEYRFRGDTSRVAFTESTFRLATDVNSPSVARSMVDVAETRNWKAIRVAGSEDFRRMVWLEASVRGVKALGYDPNPADLEVLKKEREARLVNRIEPEQDAGAGKSAEAGGKRSGRGGGGRKAVLAGIEALLIDRGVPEHRRREILDAAGEKLTQRTREGRQPKVRVYDKAAPSQRPPVTPPHEVQRSRERPAPSPSR